MKWGVCGNEMGVCGNMGVTTIYFGGDVSPRILEKYQSVPPNNRPIIL